MNAQASRMAAKFVVLSTRVTTETASGTHMRQRPAVHRRVPRVIAAPAASAVPSLLTVGHQHGWRGNEGDRQAGLHLLRERRSRQGSHSRIRAATSHTLRSWSA